MNKRGFSILLIVLSTIVVYASVFNDLTQSDFNQGNYANTTNNGTSVLLSGTNLTGTFTSRVFDASSSSRWNNITASTTLPQIRYLFAVDAQGKVYSSSNGVTWLLKNSSYGRTTDTQDMFSDSTSLYIISNANREVWKSSDNGVTWINVNDTFSNLNLFAGESDSNNLYVISGQSTGKVYKSTDSGTSWTQINDSYNGGNGAAKGMTSLIKQTNLTFQVKNCSLSDCSDGIWQNINLSNINLTGRYFQYKVLFSSQDTTITPQLFNVSIDYTILDNTPPNVTVTNPRNVSYNVIVSSMNYTVGSDAQSCWYSINNGQTNITITCGNNITSLSSAQGSNIWIVYANDSLGNVNSSSVTFFVDSISPLISYGIGVDNDGANFSRNWLYVNVSVAETNEANITFSLYNLTYLVNETIFTSPARTMNWTALSDGKYYYNATVVDTANNKNSTSTRILTLDTTGPTINIIYPEARTYGVNISIPLNISVSDSGVGINSCWYNLDSGANISIVNCQNTTFNATDGSHTIYVYANDSLGNLNYANRSFFVSTALAISLNSPSDNSWLSYQNIEFNYTVETASSIKNCSLWLNSTTWHLNQTNSSLINATGRINQFYLNLTDSSYIWNVYCQGNYNSFALNNRTLNIDTTTPVLSINSPQNNSLYKQNISLILNFSVSDSNLQKCWYIFNNGQTNHSLNCINGNNNLTFNYLNGTYNLTIYANDSAANLALFRVENITILYDDIPPNLTILEPSGTKFSKTNIPLTFAVSDNADETSQLSCWFNVTYTSTGGYVSGLDRVELSGCNSTTLNVPSDSDYTLLLSAKDRTGNINTSSSNFTVSTSTSSNPPSSGGGGGGGGASVITTKKNATENETITYSYALEITPISRLIINPGETKKMLLKIRNTGNGFLNDCKLKGQENWISSDSVLGLSAGEIKEFLFSLNVPKDAKASSYNIELSIECQELSKSSSFAADIIEKKLSIELLNAEKLKDKIKVSYALSELSGYEQEVEVQIVLLGLGNERIAELTEKSSINANSKETYESLLSIPQSLKGSYNLLINANSPSSSAFVQEDIFLGGTTIGGFTLFLNQVKTGNILGIVLVIVFIVFMILIVRRIKKLKKMSGDTTTFHTMLKETHEKLKNKVSNDNKVGHYVRS